MRGLRFWAVVLACAALAVALGATAGAGGLRSAETKPPPPKKCIVTYRGKQYDLTTFNVTGDHPGGDLLGQCGKVVDTVAPDTHSDDRMDLYLVKPPAAKPPAKPPAKPSTTPAKPPAKPPAAKPAVAKPPVAKPRPPVVAKPAA